MKIIRTIAAAKTQRPSRCEQGTYEAALEIEVDGQTGLALFFYEWDKRDVLTEELLVEPCILEAARAACPEEGPSVINGIFGSSTATAGDQNEFHRVREVATEVVYQYE